MKNISWNLLKNERLKQSRGVSFEELISKAELIAIKKHPNREKQSIMLFEYKRRQFMMREPKLTKNEKEIENALILNEYMDVSKIEFAEIAQSIKARQRDSVLNIRVNHEDLKKIKNKAEKVGVRYQSFLSELIHRVASA